jgi:uncharacterized damage-inducible protein DinB
MLVAYEPKLGARIRRKPPAWHRKHHRQIPRATTALGMTIQGWNYLIKRHETSIGSRRGDFMDDAFRTACLKDMIRTYRNYKSLGEAALAQLSDDELHTALDPESNSIAVIVKHLTGNLRSRFTDFLTSDGEKPDRNRDAEFEMPERVSRQAIMQWWDSSWAIALASIQALTPADLDRKVTIRKEQFDVIEALNRLATHSAYHVGQIVFFAKHLAGSRWKSLSIPKGKSKQVEEGSFKQGILAGRKT